MNNVISRLGELKSSGNESSCSLQEDGPWPLTKLKRENTCLVVEDDTLIVRIPYSLERMYQEHLRMLRDEEIN